ncbi:hypothetical protein J8L70_00390 [Pseudoalteromonas sp. MMG010]|nr:hypothetical protein [Pseudoalteromonas sp. MMG010]MBQ4831695.1 hypothetical protein [Pseudoalteromonas sp. MMG010]
MNKWILVLLSVLVQGCWTDDDKNISIQPASYTISISVMCLRLSSPINPI